MSALDRLIGRLTLLVLVFILVMYNQGTTNVITAFFGALGGLTRIFQGLGPNGPYNYPR